MKIQFNGNPSQDKVVESIPAYIWLGIISFIILTVWAWYHTIVVAEPVGGYFSGWLSNDQSVWWEHMTNNPLDGFLLIFTDLTLIVGTIILLAIIMAFILPKVRELASWINKRFTINIIRN